MDLPTLQAIAARTWGKEDELKALKAELATLDQKITAELAPNKKNRTLARMSSPINRHSFREWRLRSNLPNQKKIW